MAAPGNQQPPASTSSGGPPSAPRPAPPTGLRSRPVPPPRKPPQVLMIKKDEPGATVPIESSGEAPAGDSPPSPAAATSAKAPQRPPTPGQQEDLFDLGALEGLTMADLLAQQGSEPRTRDQRPSSAAKRSSTAQRVLDEFDFDEEAFLAALDEQDFVGTAGEVVRGTVIGLESDGVYVDIGGKAPGFMPKKECGLGVITNLKERFPRGLEVEVLVTRDQNADGMVTISARALALRHSWDKVRALEKEGKVVQVKVNGFNRGGVTCDLEGLRGFIPRSQLQDGENHEALVGKTLGVTFLEVNPETRKLVLSEKKATIAARFADLEVGQLVEGVVASVKPYGFFVDLGGISGLLHQSAVTGGQLRDLREVFDQSDRVKALITELDPGRGRIALNTALLEGQPGELLIERDKVMAEAGERANRARSLLRQQEQSAG
ncbi:MAG: S1 RNA-binding domain-containing protein [Cyanobacteriota bacterium]|nr:S1 RNA-binding domain-containing protein [Cyanobacteriota bacterium]